MAQALRSTELAVCHRPSWLDAAPVGHRSDQYLVAIYYSGAGRANRHRERGESKLASDHNKLLDDIETETLRAS